MGFKNQTALMKAGTQALVKYRDLAETIVTPSADIFETEESFVVKLDMPGVSKDAIQVTAKSGQLLIQATIDIQERRGCRALWRDREKVVPARIHSRLWCRS
ncbi:MAG: Hsp20/alpha crystallin family protein [bacterium]